MQGIKPKDHTKQNKEFIKTKQEMQIKKKEEESRQKQEPFKMRKFQNVPSRVNQNDDLISQQRPGTAQTQKSVIAFGKNTKQESKENILHLGKDLSDQELNDENDNQINFIEQDKEN